MADESPSPTPTFSDMSMMKGNVTLQKDGVTVEVSDSKKGFFKK